MRAPQVGHRLILALRPQPPVCLPSAGLPCFDALLAHARQRLDDSLIVFPQSSHLPTGLVEVLPMMNSRLQLRHRRPLHSQPHPMQLFLNLYPRLHLVQSLVLLVLCPHF